MLDLSGRASYRAERREKSAAFLAWQLLSGWYGDKPVTLLCPTEEDAEKYLERVRYWLEKLTPK